MKHYSDIVNRGFPQISKSQVNFVDSQRKLVLTNSFFSVKPKVNLSHSNRGVQASELTEEEILQFPQELYLGSSHSASSQNLNVDKNLNTFYKRFIAKYFGEDIVFYNNSSGILMNSIKKEQLLSTKEKAARKNMQKKLKRALLIEQIHFAAPESLSSQKANSMKVAWKKNLILLSPKKFFTKISNIRNLRSPDLPTSSQKELLNKLNDYPVFSVENNLRQIILSYPPEIFLKNFQDKLYDFYYRLFEWEHDTRATNLGFFFFNPDDANLYLQNIQKSGALSANDLGAKISVFNLSTAYKLSQTSPPETRFLFIPDLKEIGNLITQYQFKEKKRLSFHPSQKITKTGFANQPVYIIQDMYVKQGLFRKEIIRYNLDKNNGVVHLFLSLEGADLAWNLYKQANEHLRLPAKPNLLVYNLHDFIKDYIYKSNSSFENFQIIPNRQTVYFINSLKDKVSSKNGLTIFYDKYVSPKIFFIYLWLNRIKLVLLHAPRINEFPRRELLISNKKSNSI